MVHFFELLESGDMELSPEDTEKLRDLFFQLQKSKAGDLHE